MVSAGDRQPREAPRTSSLPTLASTGSCARLRPADAVQRICCCHVTAYVTAGKPSQTGPHGRSVPAWPSIRA